MKSIIFFITCIVALVSAQSGGPCSAQAIPGPYRFVALSGNNFVGAASTVCVSSGSSVWYTVTSATPITLEISTCSAKTDFDTILLVATGSSCSALTCDISNDDAACVSASSTSTIILPMQANVLYYIGVAGFSSSTGNYVLTLKQVDQQACQDAQVLKGPFYPPVQFITNNSHGSIGFYEPACDLYTEQKVVWYSISTPSTVPLTISTCNTTSTALDTVITVFTGTCTSLQCLAYDDDSNCQVGYASIVTIIPTVGVTYLVGVTGYGGDVGSFSLSFAQVPPSSCASAYPIYPGNTLTQQINGQPIVSSDPCGVITGKAGFWLLLGGLSPSVNTTVSTCSQTTNFDTLITVYSGSSCSALTCVASNDDSPCPITGETITSTVSFVPSASTTYYAVVSAYSVAQGTFVFSLNQDS